MKEDKTSLMMQDAFDYFKKNIVDPKFNEVRKEIEALEIWTKKHEAEGQEYGCDFENRDKEIISRIEKLESHYYSDGDLSAIHGQIKNLNKNNDFLENEIKRFELRCIDVEKALENYRQYKTDIEDLETDVMYLKEHIKQYHELMLGACPLDIEKTIRENMKGKSPHKCPVCEGFGRHYVDPNRPLSGIENAFMPRDERGLQYRNCQACKSTGVVWG